MIPKKNLENKSKEELLKIANAVQALADEKKYNAIATYFPEDGKYKRDAYQKHLTFFSAGSKHTRRAFIAGNRIGKSFSGAYELVCHLTGQYPSWWIGKRFTKPINAWACGVTTVSVKETIQELLFGNFADKGSGLIPKTCLVDHKGDVVGKDNLMTWNMPGAPNTVSTCLINHVSGGISKLDFKSYDQGWEKFQGAKRDVIWLDEEPADPRIYNECIMRTAGDEGKEGILYCTFTPLQGYSEIVLSFLPKGQMPPNGIHPEQSQKFVVAAGWGDVPHISDAWKAQQILDLPPNEIEARSKGIPSMGSGRVFPIEEKFVVVPSFEIPEHWPRAFGLDFGWTHTATVWVAQDPNTKIKYVYAEYQNGKVIDLIHIEAIAARGTWIPGIADPSGGGRRDDGTSRFEYFRTKGLKLTKGKNAVIAGVARLLGQFESGSLKIMDSCRGLIDDLRVLRYDLNDPNKIADKQMDHRPDALRYVDSMFEYVAISESDADKFNDDDGNDLPPSVDKYTGY